MGDAAYGDGGTRQTFADAGRRLVAKAPGRPDRKHFPKNDFHLDLAAGSCTCPAGQVTGAIVPAGKRTDGAGRVYRLQAFQFDGAVCRACPLRSQCIAAQGRKGRRVLIHPQEGMLQQARALQQSADYDEYRARRVVVEHRLARLVQLGIRQARYFGRVKTTFQLYLAARWPISPWWRAKSGGRAVPAAAQQATASSAMMSALWSPMRRPISAPSGSDNYGL